MHDTTITRRLVFAGGALGAAVAAGIAGQAAAAEATLPRRRSEQANLKLVEEFCRSWGEKDFDPDKAMPVYLAADCSVRVIDSQPFVSGPAAVAAAFKAYMPHGERFKVKFLSTYAAGPIVVTHRIDTEVLNGKSGKPWEIVGVFLVRKAKIQEWTDYVAA